MKGLRWRLGRRPSPALIVAIVALVFAVAPVADAATRAVKRALFASNAGKVNGLRASKTPKPGRLLALDAKGRFPASVLPASAQGPAGPQGPKGDQGAKGDKGEKGDVGPTAGFGNGAFNAPPAVMDVTPRSLTVDLPTGGRLLVMARMRAGIGCSSGSCSTNYGVWVDSTPVPATGFTIDASAGSPTTTEVVTFGVSGALAAGSHTVKLVGDESGSVGSLSFDETSLDAVLLGG
jgi:hypothetical protein